MKIVKVLHAILWMWTVTADQYKYEVYLLNDDVYISVDAEIDLNITTHIYIGNAGRSRGGETIIDFNSRHIGLRSDKTYCYVFPIPEEATFEEFNKSLSFPPDPDGKLRVLRAMQPYSVENMIPFGPTITSFCSGRQTLAIQSVLEEEFALSLFGGNVSSHCIFSGYVYFRGCGALTCFQDIQSPKNVFTYKIKHGSSNEEVLVVGMHPLPSLSFSEKMAPYLHILILKPATFYSSAVRKKGLKKTLGFGGSILYKDKMAGIVNLLTGDNLVYHIPDNANLEIDFASASIPPPNNVPSNVICDFENKSEFRHQNLIFFCDPKQIKAIKNCRPMIGSNSLYYDSCKFLGFMYDTIKRINFVCIYESK